MATNNYALKMNGTTQHAKLSTNASLKGMSAFTWMAWFKIDPLSNHPYKRAYVERQGTGTGIRFAFIPYSTRIRFEFSPKDGTTDTNYDYRFATTNQMTDDRWHHAAFIARVSGTPSYEIFLDGVQVASGMLVVPAATTAVSNTTPLGGSIYVGNHSLHTTGGDVFPSDRYWNGKLDEILIFNEAKNQTDITSYFGSRDTWATSDAAMFSYWQFTEGTGEGTGATTIANAKTPAWTGTLFASNVASQTLWTIDRPFLGNGTLDTTAPSVPGLPATPTTAITTDGFTATWLASTDNVWVQDYELQVSLVSNFASYTPHLMGRLLTKAVTGLLPNTNYYWRVRALDAKGNASGYAAQQSLTTLVSGDLTPPLAPTNLAASQITHSSFRVTWTASASTDETGYKIDVASDPLFTNYLLDHRNRDVGNVVQFDVFGTQPLTTYYVRLRAYDAAQNESVESVTLVVQTTTRPDTNPPLVVELLQATSTTSNAATLNWNEGIDDIGVAYYLLDVALNDAFTSYLTTGATTWAGVNVGNVLSYRLENLLAETTYYYRVRAVDSAGNVSQNPSAGESFVTTHSSVNEGGFVATTFDASQDSWVNSALTTTNYGTTSKLYVRNATGHAITFDGTDDYIDVPDGVFFDGSSFSIEAWVFPTSHKNNAKILDFGNGDANNNVALWSSVGTTGTPRFEVHVGGTPTSITSSVAMTLNIWNHVVATYDVATTTARLYLNGTERASSTTFTAVPNNVTRTSNYVGRSNTAADAYFGGRMEDLAVYGTVLSAADVTTRRNAGTPHRDHPTIVLETANPIFYMPMDELTGATVVRESIAARNGTPFGVTFQGATTMPTAIYETYLQFDLLDVVGTIQNAVLRLFVRDPSPTAISVTADNITFNETTLTYANKPTPAGSALTFTALNSNEWVSIDISSLLLDGITSYTIRLTMPSGGTVAAFDSAEGEFVPQLEIETDPSVATTIDPVVAFHDHSSLQTNYVKNPSFEAGNSNLWTAIGTPTLSVVTTEGYSGTRSLEIIATAVANQGVTYAINDVPAAQNQVWTATIAGRQTFGAGDWTLYLREYSAGGSLLAESSVPAQFISTMFRRISITRTLTNASTAFVTVAIVHVPATAATCRIDTIMLTRMSDQPTGFNAMPAYFDGNTSSAWWTGTVNASTSQIGMAEFHADSVYVGDSDGDNSVVTYFKPTNQSEWINWSPVVYEHNRTTKRFSSLLGPSYGTYNFVRNPSFETNVSHYTIVGTGTLAQATDQFYVGAASAKFTVPATVNQGIRPNYTLLAAVGERWNGSAMVKAPVGVTVKFYIRALDSGAALISESTLVGEGEALGNGEWQKIVGRFALPASTNYVEFELRATTTVAGDIYVDAVYFGTNAVAGHNNPYRDGNSYDGLWEGVTDASFTSIRLMPETSYDVRHVYTDPDGFVETSDTTLTVSGTHTTTATPDNVTTTTSLTLTPSTDTLAYFFAYQGDDNNNMSVVVEWKRNDLTNWAAVVPIYERPAKHVHGTIANLKPGTSYNVRVTVSDANGVYGTNPMTATTNTLTDVQSADAPSTIMFGGFVLMGRADGKIGVSAHDAFGLPNRRVQIENLPRVDGAIELQNLWGERTISMQGFVEGETRAELEDNKNALKRALAAKLQPLVIDTLSNQGRYYTATCESLAIAEQAGETIRHLLWDAEFVCADPFAYDSALTMISEFTASNGNTITLTNLGDLRVDPHIKLRTTHTSAITLTIINNTTGERITPTATIINGDRIVIDTARLLVTKNGVEIDYAGGFPHLTVGANEFQFTLSAPSGTPTILVEITWRQRFL